MDGHVGWMTELTVRDGELSNLRELMGEMVDATRDEPGALAYEWYISPDESTVHLFERYADSEAAIAHAKAFMADWAARYLACVKVTRLVAYGDPSPAAREILDSWRATYMGILGGFSR